MKTYLRQGAALMAALLAMATLGLAAQQPAEATAAFTQAEQALARVLHTPPRHRRLFGLSRLVVWGSAPVGATNVHLATFDIDAHWGELSSGARAQVGTALAAVLGAPWQLLDHRTSDYGEIETWVYVQPHGAHVTTIVCQIKRGQATLVMANADPQSVLDSLQGHGILLWSRKSVVRGVWGGLGDGSGFGPGFSFATPTGSANLAQLHGSAQVTYRGYLKTTLGFRLDPTGGDMHTYSLDLTGRYQVSPDVDFFGLGPNSAAQRTLFNRQERGVRLTFGVRPARALRFGVGEDYAGNRVFAGADDGYANAQTTFAPAAVPGLARGANLLSTFAFAQYDTRDFPGNPHRGIYLRLAASDNNGTGHSGYGYWHYQADARGYLPLTRESDVLAGRVLSIWNLAKPGEAVPFFEMARLGDSSMLRGYRPYRFYGANAVASSLEYRHFFSPSYGAFLFGDIGQVYGARSELTRSNMRTTWGVGLLFLDSRRQTSFKIFFALTPSEGHRWFLTQGPAF